MRAVLTPDDLKRGDLLEPKWYKASISKYEEAVVKGTKEKPSDGSTNCIFYIKLDDGPELKRYFNEKALGFGKSLWVALEFPKNALGGYDLDTELFKQTVGSRVEVYIKRGISDTGKDFNDIADFKKLT